MMIRKLVAGNRTILLQNRHKLGPFAEIFSKLLVPGDFVALTGTLGAGKTTFVQLLCQCLGVKENVTSPTFTLLNEYQGAFGLILHGDFYRMEPEEIERLLPEWEERFSDPQVITMMEWADKSPDLEYRWTWHLDFAMIPGNDQARHIKIASVDPSKLTSLEDAFDHAS